MYPTMTSVQKELKKIYMSDSYYKLFHVLIIKYILTFAWLNRAGNRETSDVVRELDDMIFKYVEKEYSLGTSMIGNRSVSGADIPGLDNEFIPYQTRRENFEEFYVKAMNSGFSKNLGSPAKVREFILGITFECRNILGGFMISDGEITGSSVKYILLIANVLALISNYVELHIPNVDSLDGEVYSIDITKLNNVILDMLLDFPNQVVKSNPTDKRFVEFDISYVKNFFKQFGLII